MSTDRRWPPHDAVPGTATDDGDSVSAAPRPGDIRLIGMHGPFTSWGLSVLIQLLNAVRLTPRVMALADTPPRDESGDEEDPGPRILLTYGPAMVHSDLMTARRTRTVVLLDEPAWSVGWMISNGSTPREAMRAATATLAPLGAVLREPGVLLIRRTPDMDRDTLWRALAAHLLPASVAPCLSSDNSRPDETSPPLSQQDEHMVHASIDPLLRLATARESEPVTWLNRAFVWGDHPHEEVPPALDLVGPARVLYYGPYLHLPAGRWQIEAEFWFSEEARGKTFGLEVFAGAVVVRKRIRPPHGGRFQATIPFTIERSDVWIEFRVWLERGAIDGRMGLRHALLRPLGGEDT